MECLLTLSQQCVRWFKVLPTFLRLPIAVGKDVKEFIDTDSLSSRTRSPTEHKLVSYTDQIVLVIVERKDQPRRRSSARRSRAARGASRVAEVRAWIGMTTGFADAAVGACAAVAAQAFDVRFEQHPVAGRAIKDIGGLRHQRAFGVQPGDEGLQELGVARRLCGVAEVIQRDISLAQTVTDYESVFGGDICRGAAGLRGLERDVALMIVGGADIADVASVHS